MAELKPCPFCGYKGIEILTDDNEYLYYRYFSQCQRCGAGAKRGHTKEDAVKEWNRRAAEPIVEAEWIYGDKMQNYPRIPYQYNRHYCSACESPAVAKEHDRWDVEEFLTPRCPHCGAHMRNGG